MAIAEEILGTHATALGRDFAGYRHHVYRVVNLCVTLAPPDTPLEKVAVAAAFHDIGIWTERTFDYLEPSVDGAVRYLRDRGRLSWVDEIAAMIREHHRLTRVPAGAALVESFRRADWIDVSRGAIRGGVSRSFVRDLYARWPSAGFHRRLLALAAARLATHPFSPLPMLRL